MAAGSQWKHLEFTLALSKRLFSVLNFKTSAQALLSSYWLLRTRNHKANQYFRTRNMLPETKKMSRIVKKTVFYFKNKAVHRAVDGPTHICLKMTFT